MSDDVVSELRALEDRRGRLTAEAVVEAAEPEDSVLHDCFEWDNDAAAHSYRIEQARELLRRVKIEVEIEERTVRVVGYVRDPEKAGDKPGYINTLKVRGDTATDLMRAELGMVSADLARVVGLALAKSAELPEGLSVKIAAIKGHLDRLSESL